MRRVHMPYWDWEDWAGGMYALAFDGQSISRSRHLLRDDDALRIAMLAVIDEWPKSALHNLSAMNRNRRAWLGQAACALVCGSSDDSTKLAWHQLTPCEQDAANSAADDVLTVWEGRTVAQTSLGI